MHRRFQCPKYNRLIVMTQSVLKLIGVGVLCVLPNVDDLRADGFRSTIRVAQASKTQKTNDAADRKTASADPKTQSKSKAKSLFNGIDLTGWHVDIPHLDKNPDAKPTFIVRDKKLVSLGNPQGHLITDAKYKNYRLEVEYRFAGTPGNCGVLVHASTPRILYKMFPKSIEVQMNHRHAGDFWCIGADISVPDMERRRGPRKNWGVVEGKGRRIMNLTDDSEKPVGEWNTMVIDCVADTVKVNINGDSVNYGTACSVSSGQIALQAEGSEVEFRKLLLTPFSREDVERIKASQPQEEPSPTKVNCEGTYSHHLQGICIDEKAIYWSFTTTLVKTDMDGTVLNKIPVANHHGDLCHHDGKLYVAVNLGSFNDPKGNADSWVYVYDAQTLKETARRKVPEVFHGAGGIGFRDGHFYVVGGLPGDIQENYVYEYDGDFKFLKKHIVKSGQTHLGIQTAAFADNRWWFGCYGSPKILLVTDKDFQSVKRYEFDCSLGIDQTPDGRMIVASGQCKPAKSCSGTIQSALSDTKTGLRLETATPSN